MKKGFILFFLFLLFSSTSRSQEKIFLTLDKTVDIAMQKSYRIKMLEMRVKSSTMKLKAREAALKTQVFMNIKAPDIENISDYKWNSNLQQDEIVRQNTTLWQSELSVQQPLNFWGYPTNGFISLNYKLYRYTQSSNDDINQTDFYNRFYLKFVQPFFLPNDMKNRLEEAELELRDKQLEYLVDQMEIVEDIADEYYDLFERNYKKNFYKDQVTTLIRILEIAKAASLSDSSHIMDVSQIQLDINNAEEMVLSEEGKYRERIANIKQKLRLTNEYLINLGTDLNLKPIEVNIEEAISFGLKLNPDLERLQIEKEKSEILKEYEEGENTFHMTLEATYGLEKKNQVFRNLWDEFDNSNSISLNAYLPIWDGGGNKFRVQAAELDIIQNELSILEKQQDIKKNIKSSYISMNEYYERLKNIISSVSLAEELTEKRISLYTEGKISLTNLLKTAEQVTQTKHNLIEVYIRYRKTLLELKKQTYYDFENNRSLLDDFSNDL